MSYLFSKCDHTIGSELEFSGSLSKKEFSTHQGFQWWRSIFVLSGSRPDLIY